MWDRLEYMEYNVMIQYLCVMFNSWSLALSTKLTLYHFLVVKIFNILSCSYSEIQNPLLSWLPYWATEQRNFMS